MKREDLFDECHKLERHATTEDFHLQLASFADQLGFFQYLYSAVPTCHSPNSDVLPICHTNYDTGWMDYYNDRGYVCHDPLFLHCLSGSSSPAFFKPGIPLELETKKSGRVRAEAAEVGIEAGFTLPMHNFIGSIGILTLTFKGPARQFESFCLSRLEEIRMFGYAFNEAIQRRFSPNYLSPFVPRITAKEKEVLNWLARGLNYEQIAEKQMVGISTIRKQISNVINKLGAKNSVHACTLALRWNLIS